MTFPKYLITAFFLCFTIMANSQSRTIDSLQQIIDNGKKDAEYNKALNAIATEYTRSDLAKAKSYLYQSIDLASKLENPVLISYAYSQMVTVQMNTGRKDSSIYFLSLLKILAEKNVPDNVKANYYLAAGLFYKKQGDYVKALPFMLKSLENYFAQDKLNSNPGTKTSIAGQSLNIGNTYMDLGNYKKALEYHLRGLKVFEEVNNKRGISFCYQAISSDFTHLGQYKQAVNYADLSIALKKEMNDRRGLATASIEYGTIYSGMGKFDQALDVTKNAIVVLHDMKLLPEETKAITELGKVYLAKKDTAQARSEFNKAIALATQIKDSSLLNSAEAALATLNQSIALRKKAEEKMLNNLKHSIESGDKAAELSSYQYLANYYSTNQEYDKALEYTRKLYEVTDSTQNNALQLQLKRMEEQYALDKKEAEISLLKKDRLITEKEAEKRKNLQWGIIIFLSMLLVFGAILLNRYRTVQKAKRIIEIERMRNHIAQDLHDEIGSTLTSINILSKMMLQQQAASVTNDNPLQKIKDHSSSIMESMSDIVWAINPQNDSMEKILLRLKTFASETLEPININYTIEEKGNINSLDLDVNKRKDIYLICKEAISNAAKYSQCKNLSVVLNLKNQLLEVVIKDDGNGFENNSSRKGNGLRNMASRAKSMNGSLQIQSAIGAGTTVSLEVPVT